MSTAYHPQTDGQTERVNQEIEGYLRIYCGNHPEEWAHHIPDMEFAHNVNVHSATNQAPFALMMGYLPTVTPELQIRSSLPSAENRLKELSQRRDEAHASIEIAKQRMAERVTRNFVPFKEDQMVWLEAKNLNTGGAFKKLRSKREGPFRIKKVMGPLVYQLDLPQSWKIHDVFHASLLSAYQITEAHGPSFTEPPPEKVDGEDEYEIEAIVNHRKGRNGQIIWYEVAWKGWPSSENSRLKPEMLNNAQELVAEYKERHNLT